MNQGAIPRQTVKGWRLYEGQLERASAHEALGFLVLLQNLGVP
jgi:hypothetical protein